MPSAELPLLTATLDGIPATVDRAQLVSPLAVDYLRSHDPVGYVRTVVRDLDGSRYGELDVGAACDFMHDLCDALDAERLTRARRLPH